MVLVIVLVMLLRRRWLTERVEKRGLVLFLGGLVIPLGGYLLVHMPDRVEYKWLIVFGLMLGVAGGIAFRAWGRGRWRHVVFFILLVFMLPSGADCYVKATRLSWLPPDYEETDMWLRSRDSEERQLYAWIRRETGMEDVFIDTCGEVPVFAHRRLFVGRDILSVSVSGGKRRSVRNPGYSFSWRGYLENICCEDAAKIGQRQGLVECLYSPGRRLNGAQVSLLEQFPGRVYVICRGRRQSAGLRGEPLQAVFRTQTGELALYMLSK
jgi:hypothetical protein